MGKKKKIENENTIENNVTETQPTEQPIVDKDEPKIDKPKQKKKSTNEKSDYTKLTDYIQAVFFNHGYADNDAIPWVYLMSQVRLFQRTYSMTYPQQLAVLKYMVEIKGIDITKDETLGLVPWYRDETARYIYKYKMLKEQAQEFDLDNDKVININKEQNQRIRFKKLHITFDD